MRTSNGHQRENPKIIGLVWELYNCTDVFFFVAGHNITIATFNMRFRFISMFGVRFLSYCSFFFRIIKLVKVLCGFGREKRNCIAKLNFKWVLFNLSDPIVPCEILTLWACIWVFQMQTVLNKASQKTSKIARILNLKMKKFFLWQMLVYFKDVRSKKEFSFFCVPTFTSKCFIFLWAS